jgi:transcriptional regulator with XRE-family HTH domain
MATEQWFLRSLREELRLTQEDVASDSNLTQGKISAFERGAEIPGIDECRAIVNAMVRRAAVRGLEILILERK